MAWHPLRNRRPGPMEIRQLRYFARTFEMGNITRAAAALSIVQPALSQQL